MSACMTEFEMSSMDTTPSATLFPPSSAKDDTLQRRRTLLDAVQKVLDKHVKFSLKEHDDEDEDETSEESDHVQEYAREVLTLGLLYMEFVDAIREGDGERIFRCWRYFLLLFKATDRRNYSIEAFTLLIQHHFMFSKRMRMQLQWSRTVNVHGRPGKNVSCDLHMEHLNRECKGSISGLGANITDDAIQRVGKSLRTSTKILSNFDLQNSIQPESGYHTIRSSDADISKLLKQIHNDSQVFSNVPGRKHSNFPHFQSNLVQHLSKPKLLQWFQERLQQLLMYH